MFFLASPRISLIAHDRRGHGRSSQPWNGNDMDTYADDLAALVEALDLRNAVHVGHSTGGGEVARYIGRHGTERVAKAVLIGAVPPLMLKTAANPGGMPIEAFDQIRPRVHADRSQFWKDLSMPFYGYNRPGATSLGGGAGVILAAGHDGRLPGLLFLHQGVLRNRFHRGSRRSSTCRRSCSTAMTTRSCPLRHSAMLSAKLIKNAKLKVYKAPRTACAPPQGSGERGPARLPVRTCGSSDRSLITRSCDGRRRGWHHESLTNVPARLLSVLHVGIGRSQRVAHAEPKPTRKRLGSLRGSSQQPRQRRISIHQLRGNIAVLEGSGGNVAVLSGRDGETSDRCRHRGFASAGRDCPGGNWGPSPSHT